MMFVSCSGSNKTQVVFLVNIINSVKKYILRFDARRKFFYGLGATKRLLDVGCGKGKNSTEIKELYPEIEIHGVDLIKEKEIPAFIKFEMVDLETQLLPYPDESFDTIIVAHVLEHLHFPLRLGPEIYRLLKKGGRVYIETPNWTSLFVPSLGLKREQLNTLNFYDDHTHVKPWSKQGIFSFLQSSCNLRVENVGTVRNFLRIPLDPFVIIWGFLSGNRNIVVSAIWNLYGWRIYGIGKKDESI